MSNVIGPISEEDWLTMRLIRTTVPWMKSKDAVKYKPSIEMEENIYKKIRASYLNDNKLDAGILREAG